MDKIAVYTLHLINASLWLIAGVLLLGIDGGVGTLLIVGALIAKGLIWLGIASNTKNQCIASQAFQSAD